MARSKYRAQRTEVDGIVFDSKAEAGRYQELKLLERAGAISNLQRQVRFELAPSVLLHGEKRMKPALYATIDFAYNDKRKEQFVYEDKKGFDNAKSRLKRHLLKAFHNIDVVLT